LVENAQNFAEKIRGHWKIENQLHWVKDVIFKEDTLPITDFQAVSNLSILQTIALNLFRNLGFLSITEGQRWLNHRWFKLWDLLE
jgi:predicted transposase YbfD/YdcC